MDVCACTRTRVFYLQKDSTSAIIFQKNRRSQQRQLIFGSNLSLENKKQMLIASVSEVCLS